MSYSFSFPGPNSCGPTGRQRAARGAAATGGGGRGLCWNQSVASRGHAGGAAVGRPAAARGFGRAAPGERVACGWSGGQGQAQQWRATCLPVLCPPVEVAFRQLLARRCAAPGAGSAGGGPLSSARRTAAGTRFTSHTDRTSKSLTGPTVTWKQRLQSRGCRQCAEEDRGCVRGMPRSGGVLAAPGRG